MSKLEQLFGKYWPISTFMGITLLIYALLLTLGLLTILNDPSMLNVNDNSSNNKEGTAGRFSVVVIYESRDPSKLITWDPTIIERNESITLLEILNGSTTLSGKTYVGLGFYITSINGLSESLPFFWHIYYYSTLNGWIFSPWGSSSIVITTDSYFRLVYDS